MINKKIVIAFMVVYLVCTLAVFSHSALLSYFVSQLAPATAAATTGGANVAAKIAATAAGGSASKWVSLFVPGAGLAKIGALGLAIGLTIAGDYIYDECKDWFDAQKIDRNGVWQETKNYPAGTNPAKHNVTDDASNFGGLPQTDPDMASGSLTLKYAFIGIFDSQAEAIAARDAWWTANTCAIIPDGYCTTCSNGACTINQANADGAWTMNGVPTGFPNIASPESNGITWSKWATVANRKGWKVKGSVGVEYVVVAFYPYPGVPLVPHDVPKQLTPAELEAKMAANMTDALAAGILREAARILSGSDFKVAAPANYTVIQNTLNNAVTTQNQTDVETAIPETVDTAVESSKADVTAAIIAALKAQNLSAAQIAAAIGALTTAGASTGALTAAELTAALTSAGLSANDIAAAVAASGLTETKVKTAVKEAIDDETDVTIPVDPTIVLPDKLSLTTVMNDFWNSVQDLPIFNVLNGITINTSGTSNLCVDLPAAYGGQRCYNGANVQDELNMIGTAILGLTTVISFIGVFKG